MPGPRSLPKRVLLVLAQRAFAEALTARLGIEPDLEIVGSLVRAAPLLAVSRATQPDLVVVDQQLWDPELEETLAVLQTLLPQVGLLVVADHARPADVVDAFRAGAWSWAFKDGTTSELLGAVRAVLLGGAWIPCQTLRPVLELLVTRQGADRSVLAQLTARELEVLTAMADGLGQGAIAERLLMSPNTVRTHRRNVLAKFDVHSSVAAVLLARQAGLTTTRFTRM